MRILIIIAILFMSVNAFGADGTINDQIELAETMATADEVVLWDASTGLTKKITYLNLNDLPNLDAYGGLTAAVATISTTVKTVLCASAQPVSDDLTVPATMTIFALQECSLNPATGKTLTMDSTPIAGPYDIVGGAGTVSFDGPGMIDAAWNGGTAGDKTITGDLIVAGGEITIESSDTTLTRASAGDVNIEGNIIYRAGGTDVAAGDMVTASESAQGASELATDGETITGTATNRVVTPANITAMNAGKDIDRGGFYFTGDQGQTDLATKGPAYFFNGESTYIELADNANLDMDTNDFSVEIGFTPSNVTDTGKRLISKTDGTTGFEIVINEDDLQVAILDNANDVTLTNLATAIFSAGKRSHIEVTFDRDGNIQAYHMGKPVGTPVSCIATSTIANSSVLRIGTETGGTTNEFNGEINKVRIRTLVSTSDEASEHYSDSAIQFKHIGASRTNRVLGTDSNFSGAGNWANVNCAVFDVNITVAGKAYMLGDGGTDLMSLSGGNTPFEAGKQYRITLLARLNAGASTTIYAGRVATSDGFLAGQAIAFTPTGTEAAYTGIVTDVLDGSVLYIGADSGGFDGIAFEIDNVSVTQIGAVLQLEQPGIGHQQWIDISGNEGHGTVSGALPINLATNHREKFIDLTVTGDVSFTLPLGYQLSTFTAVCDGSIGGGIDVGTSDGGGEVITAMTVGGAGTFIGTIILATSIGGTHTTADDIFYITDADGSGWDARTCEIRAEMHRLTVN